MSGSLLEYILPILLFAVIPATGIGEEQQGKQSSTIDTLERKLELGRHEKLVAVKTDPDSILADFTTDGCSGGLSVGWTFLAERIERIQSVHGELPPWESCCVAHDGKYHGAGSAESTAIESFELRRQADRDLQTCVRQTGRDRRVELSAEYDLSTGEIDFLYEAISDLMYHAVRIGGIPCSGLPWRWGYGWPDCR